MPFLAVIFAHMRIGIVVRSNTITKNEEQEYFETLVNYLASAAPNDTFILFADNTAVPNHPNISQRQIPPITSYFKLRRWHSKTLPSILVKEKVDYLIAVNSGYINTTISQLSLIIDAKTLLLIGKSWLFFLYRKQITKSLQKAKTIATVSSPQKQELEKLFKVNVQQLFTAGYAVSATYQPADWQQRETFLQSQTGGREYFLYTGIFNEAQFLNVLKAFSLFKKRQKSNMQLLVSSQFTISKALHEKLDTYKYRSDVQLLNNQSSSLLPQLIASAYAVIFVEGNATVAYPVAAAMQCAVPVIGFENNEATAEVAGPAALYAQANTESLAEQMKLVYKDELLRQNLIAHAQQQAYLTDGKLTAENILKLLTQ